METKSFFLSITLPSLSLYLFYPHTFPLPPFTTFLPSLFHLSLHPYLPSSTFHYIPTFPLPPFTPFLYLPSSTFLYIPLFSLFLHLPNPRYSISLISRLVIPVFPSLHSPLYPFSPPNPLSLMYI